VARGASNGVRDWRLRKRRARCARNAYARIDIADAAWQRRLLPGARVGTRVVLRVRDAYAANNDAGTRTHGEHLAYRHQAT